MKSPQSNMHVKNNTKYYEPKLRKIYDMLIKLRTNELIKSDYFSQTVHLENSRLDTIIVTTTSSVFKKCLKEIYNWRRSRQIHVLYLKRETKGLSNGKQLSRRWGQKNDETEMTIKHNNDEQNAWRKSNEGKTE